MHQISEMSSFHIDEVTKVEGAAGLDVEIEDGKVKDVRFRIDECKRFYTQAMRGKPVAAIPQLLARICGTCSNAHLMASIEAVEHTLGVEPSEQTQTLRELTYHGLIIRDHALHLYLFSLPDIFGQDSLLAFDENDPKQHELLHDAFAVKAAGNALAIAVAGRSVHAPFPTVGGFSKIPEKQDLEKAVEKVKAAREAVLRLIAVFRECEFSFVRKTNYAAITSDDFSYFAGTICDTTGKCIKEENYRDHLEHVVIPYSHASGYTFSGDVYRVGAIARLNLNKEALHESTKRDAAEALQVFPSDDIFHNNLAQAIGILHSIDRTLDIIRDANFVDEKPMPPKMRAGVGIGVVEAPRGMLYHKLETDDEGRVVEGEVIVPTGQNQIAIEKDLGAFIEANLDMEEDVMRLECEKIIRAYDPCMSCASHFLKLNIKKV